MFADFWTFSIQDLCGNALKWQEFVWPGTSPDHTAVYGQYEA